MKRINFLIELKKKGKLEIVEPSEEIKNSYIEKSESNLISAKILLKNERLEEAVSLAYYSSKSISDHIEPKIYPEIKKEEIGGTPCITVNFAGNDLLYYAYGRAYMRVGDENRQLSAKEIEKTILEKNKEKMAWDKETCKEARISDISIKKLKWFLKKAGKPFDNIENSLDKLGLLKDSKLLNAAVILFGKNSFKFFQNAKLRCAVFGQTTAVTIDMQEFTGNLFDLIERAEKYILENIHIGMKLEGLYRVDIPEIDREAFREAIVNAFCHRNYYEHDSVNIAIFKDRLEIRSPGALYGGLTIEQIKKEMVSKRRNKLIADIFHIVHFVEKWGRGISLILSKEPNTNFKEIADTFITTFKREGAEKDKETVGKTVGKILALISENPKITRDELSAKTGLTIRGIEWNLEKLKQKGLLKRIGPAKGGCWEAVKE